MLRYTFVLIILSTFISISCKSNNDSIYSYTVDLKKQHLEFFWKDDSGYILKSFLCLDEYMQSKNQQLVFAMNGGMFKRDCSPLGLFIDHGDIINPINTNTSSHGNFYLQPNGVFYIDSSNTPFICKTNDFVFAKHVKFATQSGPMLVINDSVHPVFIEGSSNCKIRNGIGILPNGTLLFALSIDKVNFYDFAMFFKNNGCRNALFLDGEISEVYCPSQNITPNDEWFGVMIGVEE